MGVPSSWTNQEAWSEGVRAAGGDPGKLPYPADPPPAADAAWVQATLASMPASPDNQWYLALTELQARRAAEAGGGGS